MSDGEVKYVKKLSQAEEVPESTPLVTGYYTASSIFLTGEGLIPRGTLLMSNGDNEFVAATEAGISSAYELGILCEDVDPAGEKAGTYAYFSGEVNGSGLRLAYEAENDIHSELIEKIRVPLRRQGFMIAGK